jgi:enoyl-CoA hydratase/carnithine racemase
MMANRSESFIGDLFERCSRAMMTMRSLPQPVIARVHGIATPAGCQIVAACDLAVASTEARFRHVGRQLRAVLRDAGRPRVAQRIDEALLRDALHRRIHRCETARAWGLVNRVVAPSELDAEVARVARAIAEKPRAVVAAGKALFYKQLEEPIARAYGDAGKAITANMLGADAAEGVGAFIAKRKPRWES